MLALLLFSALVLAGQPAAAGVADPFPQTASAYLVRVDGQVLWSHQPQRHLPPASLTKLMTALLVLEHLPPGREISVSPAAARESGTRLGLKAGERFRAGELLAAMLVDSANDACRALADAVSPPDRFIALMNRQARQWGMRDTHFGNACGHDGPDHYSTVHDLTILADQGLGHPEIRGLAALPELTITTSDGRRRFHFANTNELLGRSPGVVGLKTGFTPRAGKCLIAYAERGGHRILLVMLNAHDRWWDAADILDLALAHVGPAD